MKIKRINGEFAVCKVPNYSQVKLDAEYCFISKTDEEKSLVCLIEDMPENVLESEEGWIAFRIEGELDFSLIGVLAKISALLAQENIPILAISTYNTDYVLVKKENEMKAMNKFVSSGYKVSTDESHFAGYDL